MGYSKSDRRARLAAHELSGEMCECGGNFRIVSDSLICDNCFSLAGLEEQVDHIFDVVKEKDKQKRDKLKKKKLKDLKAKMADGESTTS